MTRSFDHAPEVHHEDQPYVAIPPPEYAANTLGTYMTYDRAVAQPATPAMLDRHTGIHPGSDVLIGDKDDVSMGPYVRQPSIPPAITEVVGPVRHSAEQNDPALAWAREEPVEYASIRESLKSSVVTMGRSVVAKAVALGRKLSNSRSEKPQPQPTAWELAKQGPDIPQTPLGVYERGAATTKLRRQRLGGPNR